MMKLSDFRPKDIVKIVISDYAEGEAVVKAVEPNKLVIQWIYKTLCYDCISEANNNGLDEISEEKMTMGVVLELELLQRPSAEENQWIITEDQLKRLIDNYNYNKEDLENLELYIKKNGCTEDGLSDATESFEQGYNNALRNVFSILGVQVE